MTRPAVAVGSPRPRATDPSLRTTITGTPLPRALGMPGLPSDVESSFVSTKCIDYRSARQRCTQDNILSMIVAFKATADVRRYAHRRGPVEEKVASEQVSPMNLHDAGPAVATAVLASFA